ncbi:MAG: hypothetical protein NC816_03255, partial [Candidatus Omnitrophica bacterium]|nr:hypothetical protein [Candidatus Omnitrophota bacterium]
LNLVLQEKNLVMKKYGDIYYVTEKQPEDLKKELIKLKYINANDVIEFITPFLSSKGKVKIFKETIRGGWESTGISSSNIGQQGVKKRIEEKHEENPSILLIEDTEENIAQIKSLLNQIDKEKPKISIEVMFVEIMRDYIKDLGISWTYQAQGYGEKGGIKIDVKTGSITPPSPDFFGFTLGYSDTIGTQLFAKIQALEQEKKAKILSNPRIIVLSGHQANILVGEKYPVLRTDIIPGSTPPTLVESFDHYEPIGVSLRVIPTLIEPDLINLVIHPEVSSLGEDVVGSTGLTIKRIKTKEIDTLINVKNNSSIVIGGLISSEKRDTIYKIPFFGDVPLLKYLFQRRGKTIVQTELLIFITPKIIKTEKEIEPPTTETF